MKPTRLPLLLITLPTLIYVAALLFDPGRSLVLWERTGQFDWPSTWPLIAGLCIWALVSGWAFVRLPEAPSRWQVALILVGTVLAGLALQTAAVHVVEPYPLRGTLIRQLSPFTGGYWNVGARVSDLGSFLDQFAERMPSYTVHAQRHPPGLPLLFWMGTRLFEGLPMLVGPIAAAIRPMTCFDPLAAQLNDAQIASGLFGILIESLMVWLIPVVMFVWLRRLASVRVALLAAMLYALVPGALAWTAQFDRGFGLITVLGLYGCERMIESKKPSVSIAWPLFTGLMYSIATFMSIGNLPIILIGALYMGSRVWQQERLAQWRWRLLQASLVLLGIASVWLLCLPTGFDLIGMLRATLSTHLDLERPFWPFVLWHAWDIITFIGIPFVALGLLGLRQRQQPHVFALALSCFVTLLILCLAHVARGETGRVWMFFAPLPVALTALLLGNGQASNTFPQWSMVNDKWSICLVVLLTLTVLQGSAQIGWLRFIGYGIDPATVLNVSVPATITPTNIRYGRSGEVRMLGFEAQPALKAGDYSDVTLYWQLDSTQPLTRSYKVFVHYAPNLDNIERIVNQDSIPMNWTLPTPCWRPGQVVRDQHGIRIDPAAKPGHYLALVGLYEETSGEREYVHTAQQAKEFAVALPVKISVSD